MKISSKILKHAQICLYLRSSVDKNGCFFSGGF